jgi:spermidine synthase
MSASDEGTMNERRAEEGETASVATASVVAEVAVAESVVANAAVAQEAAEPAGPPFVTDYAGLRSLQFDGLTVQSMMSLADPAALVLDYTRTMMGFLLFVPAPRHIVMIGLGGGSLAKFCLATLAGTRFTAVEIDPEIIALRSEFGIPPDDERFRVVCADGADYLREATDEADVLLVDGFSPRGLPLQLGTAEFYADCEAMLAAGGMLVVNHWSAEPRYGLYAARIRDRFDDRVVVVGAEDGDNRIVFASKGGRFPPGRSQLAGRARALTAACGLDFLDLARRIQQRLDRRVELSPGLWAGHRRKADGSRRSRS